MHFTFNYGMRRSNCLKKAATPKTQRFLAVVLVHHLRKMTGLLEESTALAALPVADEQPLWTVELVNNSSRLPTMHSTNGRRCGMMIWPCNIPLHQQVIVVSVSAAM